jgi:hypothetical protein
MISDVDFKNIEAVRDALTLAETALNSVRCSEDASLCLLAHYHSKTISDLDYSWRMILFKEKVGKILQLW